MSTVKYKVYYIHHSTFLVELQDKYLLFDYFDKSVVEDTVVFHGCLPELSPDKMLYIFASHKHKDHFTLQVLEYANKRENVQFIFSKDIRLGFNYLKRNGFSEDVKKKILFVGADKIYEINDLKIQTLRSTDAGVAYFISVDGLNIYHAGDLNWWNLEGRGELYGEQYGREYKRYLRPLNHKRIDLAFVVLDPRLGEAGYYLGLDYFIKNYECSTIFPMHMWGQYQWIKRFKERPEMANLRDRIIDIDQENMIFEIED